MNITRRGFFKIIGATAVTTVVPSLVVPSLIAVEETTSIKPSQTVYGTMRERVEYDLGRDSFVVRHDIYDGITQLGIDQRLTDKSEKSLEEARKVAVSLLKDHMEKHGMSKASLKRFPSLGKTA